LGGDPADTEIMAMKNLTKIVWLILACGLIACLAIPPLQPDDERGIAFAYGMGALTFPVGVALLTLGGIAEWAFPSLLHVGGSRPSLVVAGSVFVLAGYLQWFVWVPRLWAAWQDWRQPREAVLFVDDSNMTQATDPKRPG
jgi:hypothetical protein